MGALRFQASVCLKVEVLRLCGLGLRLHRNITRGFHGGLVGLLSHFLPFVEFCFNVCYLLQLLFFTALHFLNLSYWFPPMIIDTKPISNFVRLPHNFSTKTIGFGYKVKSFTKPIYKFTGIYNFPSRNK